MKMISTYDFRNNLASYINEVYKDEITLLIGKFNKPMVKLVPYIEDEADDISKYFGFMKGNETGEEFVNRVRRSTKEKRYIEKLRNRNV